MLELEKKDLDVIINSLKWSLHWIQESKSHINQESRDRSKAPVYEALGKVQKLMRTWEDF
ncbi:MAG TPA: hypothetical protein DCE41_31935 [Cytophagales bacterium]|nr:hypothetical protein [Cytophagales bacterium]HAA18937.1 hypothetical protein [Cytophagales bacterium]HAP64308.1 hypothetical protein [Cytophagales bacterium]